MSVFILSATRSPIGCFKGQLSKLKATELGSLVIKDALVQSSIDVSLVDHVYMGNVCSASLGQAPARQSSLNAGLPSSVDCTTINKVCASGMKSITLAASSIASGDGNVMVAGGMESMSNVPFYIKRDSLSYGHQSLEDGIIKDGLWDVSHQMHMGNCSEHTSKVHSITRHMMDDFAILSYRRSAYAWDHGLFKNEITSIPIPSKNGSTLVSKDEEYVKVNFDKIPLLKPVFLKDGSITAANASTLNDGAAALVLGSDSFVSKHALHPLGRIVAYADAACDPIDFSIAPSLAIPKALMKASLSIKDIALWEINEAFASVVKVNEKILGLDPSLVNVRGGAVSLGHPIGASGARIVVTLLHALKKGEKGVASICNGGGGASAVVVERL